MSVLNVRFLLYKDQYAPISKHYTSGTNHKKCQSLCQKHPTTHGSQFTRVDFVSCQKAKAWSDRIKQTLEYHTDYRDKTGIKFNRTTDLLNRT